MAPQPESFTCFFYGTLMNDAILRRVIGTSSDHLQIADALLKDHTRHHVKRVDYPAVVPASKGQQVMGRDLNEDEASVRGSVVKGLTASDIRFLDTFEGDEYERQPVQVVLLSSWRATTGSSTPPPKSQEEGLDSAEPTLVPTDVYIWTDPLSKLEPSLWSYEAFLRDKSHMWIGNGEQADAEYLEVDRRRQMDGKIIRPTSLDRATKTNPQTNGHDLPNFGHEMRDKYFCFEKGYINLNHGGRGATPKPVLEAKLRWMEKNEAAPDRFAQQVYYKELPRVREAIAPMLHADADDLSFVLNATTGVNAVLRSLRWQKGDHILYYPSAVYGACSSTLMFIRDHYGVELVPVEFNLPATHEEIVDKTKQVVEETRSKLGDSGRIRLGLTDAICSMPGVVVPWERLCVLFKEYGILSLVDAAHLMGHRAVNLKQTDPDFWVSNVHKWCFAPRSVSVLYVPPRNQHLIETMPISFGYAPSREAKTVDSPSTYKQCFSFTGTQDFSNIFSITDALKFRQFCGGEERIMRYNYDLVLEGASLLANTLRTSYMENSEKSLVACMANIELPITVPTEQHGKLAQALVDTLLDKYNISAPCYPYAGKIYVRIAVQIDYIRYLLGLCDHDAVQPLWVPAQIYNEISDYEALAKALQEILKKQEELV